jgi:hypothetical protein
MPANTRYVLLKRQWRAGRWVTEYEVTDRLIDTPDSALACYTVEHHRGRQADVVATVLEWEARGRPRDMAVRRRWPAA